MFCNYLVNNLIRTGPLRCLWKLINIWVYGIALVLVSNFEYLNMSGLRAPVTVRVSYEPLIYSHWGCGRRPQFITTAN